MHFPRFIVKDLLIIFLSIMFAVLLVWSGWAEDLLAATRGVALLESFLAGLFFTSAFTTPVAMVMLGEIAQEQPLFFVAVVGGLGALVGDMIIFRFVRDRFSQDLLHLLNKKGQERFEHILHKRLFRWITPLLAALIVASPLPDELAASILGVSKTRTAFFLPFSFVANALGIMIIGLVARSVQ